MSAQLRKLQKQIDALRKKLGVSRRGEVIYLAPRDADGELVIVQADGFGGAITKVVEGNYPVDFFTSHEKSFSTETTAMEAAERVAESNVDPTEILV